MSSVFKELYLDHIVKFISMMLPVSSENGVFRRKSKCLEQSQLWTDETCPVPSIRDWSSPSTFNLCTILKSSGYSILRGVVITLQICHILKVFCFH